MPPSPSKNRMAVVTKTSVATRIAVGTAIGFIAGVLGGSYGFALLNTKLAPTLPSAPNPNQCQVACEYGYASQKYTPTYDADVQKCVKSCNQNISAGVKLPGISANQPGTPPLTQTCTDGSVIPATALCPKKDGGGTPTLCPDGKTPVPSTGICYCTNGTVMPANGVCGGVPTTPCPEGQTLGSDNVCRPAPKLPCLDLCYDDLRACAVAGISAQTCSNRYTLCANACDPKKPITRCPDGSLMPSTGICNTPPPEISCQTTCKNIYTTCAYGAGTSASQQGQCATDLTLCLNRCPPSKPTGITCPPGMKLGSGGACIKI